jgi:ABC-type transport system involved in multi-copper enzyme maturation permease subunit
MSALYIALFLHLGLWVSVLVSRPATALLLLLCIWTVWVIGLPNLAVPLGRWLRPFPPVEKIEAEKSQLRQGDFESYLDYANACWAVDDRYIAQVDAQVAFTQSLSRLSPMGAYTYGTTALAGTGLEDAQRFRDAVVRWDRDQRRSGYHWQGEIPFIYEESSPGQSWNAALPDLAILVLWNIFFLCAASFGFARRDLT